MNSAALHHLQGLQTLVQALAEEGIEMETHHYESLAFGSFELVLARGHKKVRFVWEGKDSILTVAYQDVQNRAGAAEWRHDAFIQANSPEAAFAEIGSNAVTILD